MENTKKQKGNATKRNIVLKIKTYERLEKYLVDLVKEREVPRITFDDAINDLLDKQSSRKAQAIKRLKKELPS